MAVTSCHNPTLKTSVQCQMFHAHQLIQNRVKGGEKNTQAQIASSAIWCSPQKTYPHPVAEKGQQEI